MGPLRSQPATERASPRWLLHPTDAQEERKGTHQMDAAPMSWVAAAPVVGVALLVTVGPGWLAARLIGVRGVAAAAVAPILTVSMISVLGVAAAFVGVGWNSATFVAGTLLVWLVAVVAGGGLRLARQPEPMPFVPVLVGLGISAVLVGIVFIPLTQTPGAFPQQPDTIFHLGAVQWMLEHGDISSLHAAGFSSASGTGFYPAAFHGVVVTLAQVSGASATVSTSAFVLVVAALIWPLGAMMLSRVVLGPGPAVVISAAVTSVMFSAFPFWLLGYGVLWPNLLGFALLPTALALMVAAIAPEPGLALRQRHAVLMLVLALPGLALAHPNVLIALIGFGVLIVSERALGHLRQMRRRRPRAAARGAVLLMVGMLFLVVMAAVLASRETLMRGSNPLGPEATLGRAVGEALLLAPRGGPRLWVMGAAVLVGVLTILVRFRGQRWVVAALGVSAALYVAVSGVDSTSTRWLTWPWYNNPPRLAALMVVPATVVAAASLVVVVEFVSRASWAKRGPSWWTSVLVSSMLLVATSGGYVSAHRVFIDRYFNPSDARSWASQDELNALRRLARYVGPNDVVAANPWNGATYLYLVGRRRMLFPTEKSAAPGDRALLAARLDEVGESQEVCAAARRQHVRFAITGGQRFVSGSKAFRNYPGVAQVATSAAFRQIAVAGPYRLYQLERCALN